MKFDLAEIEKRISEMDIAEAEHIITQGEEIRCLYPELADFFEDNEISLFLTRVEFWWKWKGGNMFYKYLKPCQKSNFKDSWMEELSLSDASLKRIRRRVETRTKSRSKAIELAENGTSLNTLVVSYKTSQGALEWYFNERLFKQLRATAMEMFPTKNAVAKSGISPDGHKANLTSCIYRQTTDKQKEEKMYKKEEVKEYLFSDEPVQSIDEEKREQKRKENIKKVNAPRRNKKLFAGRSMSLDFSVSKAIMIEALSQGYSQERLDIEKGLFENHYKNKNPNRKAVDWQRMFIDGWLKDGDKKYGKDAKPRKDANTERLERITELTTEDIFNGQSLDELTDKLYEQYYGSGENEESDYA